MKEISISLNLKGISKKVKQYLKNIQGGYFFEIFLASNRIISKPFKIVNDCDSSKLNQQLKIKNLCGGVLEFWLKTYSDNAFVASAEIDFSDLINQGVQATRKGEISLQLKVETALFCHLDLEYEITQREYVKQIIEENDEDVLKPKEQIDYEALERERLEEERKKRELEEQEIERKNKLKKAYITVTNYNQQNQPLF